MSAKQDIARRSIEREVSKVIAGVAATDGAGVELTRVIGSSRLNMLDPFLLLDRFSSDKPEDYIAGFPPHPHRGFETVTYMKEGAFSHEDSMGNKGSINSGGAQWMTAGSGVIHSEMPMAGADRMHGFQFWLNLPAGEKMQRPAYRDIQGDEIPQFDPDDARIRLIAGNLGIGDIERSGVVTGKTTRALIADVTLPGGGSTALSVDPELSIQFYVYEGSVKVGAATLPAGTLAYLGDGEVLHLSSDGASGLLLFGGRVIDEPVVHHGPFVMNTEQEIRRAVTDYQGGNLVQVS